MSALTEQPGLLFVVATLLPLASFVLLLLLGAVRWGLRPYAKDNPGIDSLYQFLGGPVPGVGPAHRRPDGQPQRTHYLLPFELVSVHLLVVLIGAAYLARTKRRRGATT